MGAAPCLVFTGPRGAGKTTIARLVAEDLALHGLRVEVLDDRDVVARLGPTGSPAADLERLLWMAELLRRNDVTVLLTADLPRRAQRDELRSRIELFAEVFVDALDETGNYEDPLLPEVRVVTHDRDANASAAQVVSWFEAKALAPARI